MTDAAPHDLVSPEWRPLPPRARSLFMLANAAVGVLLIVPVAIIGSSLNTSSTVTAMFALGAGAFGTLSGAWFGAKRYRTTAWRLDDEGFAYRRGRVFFRETRVPASRVQHLDLRHGPLERHWRLATLVIHTAGSKMSAVSVTGLDTEDAEQLRDRLARQLDADDAL
jgi:hypothetical protein